MSWRGRRRGGLLALAMAASVACGVAGVLSGMGAQPGGAPPGSAQAAWEMASYEAVSMPSDVRELAFGVRGRVEEVMVEAGDRVSRGDAIVRMDDLVQRRTVELARLQAADRSQIDAAEATLEFRRNDMEQVQNVAASGGANDREVWDAQYRVRVAEIELASASTKLEEDALILAREEARLSEMTIHSPIDGVVVEVHKRGGEAVDEQATAVTIIQANPLWIDVSVRARDALRLRPGQRAEVVWQDVDGVGATGGRVTYISPAGHAGARQVKVRVEVPNEGGLPTGLHATVRFLAPEAGAGEGGRNGG